MQGVLDTSTFVGWALQSGWDLQRVGEVGATCGSAQEPPAAILHSGGADGILGWLFRRILLGHRSAHLVDGAAVNIEEAGIYGSPSLVAMRCGHGAPFTWVAEGLGFCRHSYDDGEPDMWYPWSLTRPVLPGAASFHLEVAERTGKHPLHGYNTVLLTFDQRPGSEVRAIPAYHWQPVYSEEAVRLQLRKEVTARFSKGSRFVAGPTLEDYMAAFAAEGR